MEFGMGNFKGLKMMNDRPKQYRQVNQILGRNPKIGPFSTAQALAFVPILLFSYMAKQLLNLSWVQTALFATWLLGSYLILFGTRHWRYINKFTNPPYLVRGHLLYSSLRTDKPPFYHPKGETSNGQQER